MRLGLAIEHLHDCQATHAATIPHTETFEGRVIWEGEVEVFDIAGHPKAKRAYGWSHPSSNGERFVTVLEIPPVTSPETAVKAAIVSEVRGA